MIRRFLAGLRAGLVQAATLARPPAPPPSAPPMHLLERGERGLRARCGVRSWQKLTGERGHVTCGECRELGERDEIRRRTSQR